MARDSLQDAVAQAGAIEPLVKLLESESRPVRENAVGAVRGLVAAHPANGAEVAKAGGSGTLVALLSDDASGTREDAIAAVRSIVMADRDAHRALLVGVGAIPPCVALLAESGSPTQEYAAATLRSLLFDSESAQTDFVQAGGALALVPLLHGSGGAGDGGGEIGRVGDAGACGGEMTLREHAAAICWSVIFRQNEGNTSALIEAGALPPLVDLLTSGSTAAQESAIGALHSFLATGDDERRGLVVALAPWRALVHTLSSGTVVANEEAAGALRALALGSAENQAAIAEAGGIAPLMSLLARGGTSVRLHAIVILRSLSAIGEESRRTILADDNMAAVVAMLREDSELAQISAAGCLRNLALDSVANQASIVARGALEPLIALLGASAPSRIREEAAAALWSLTAADGEGPEAAAVRRLVVEAGAVRPFVALIAECVADMSVELAAMREAQEHSAAALWSLSAGDDGSSTRQLIVEEEGIPCLVRLLSTATDATKRSAAGILWNLAWGSVKNQDAIAQAGGVEALVCLSALPSSSARKNVDGALRTLADNHFISITLERLGWEPSGDAAEVPARA